MDKGAFSYNKLLQSLEAEYGDSLPKRIVDTFKLVYDAHLGQVRTTQKIDEQIPFIVHPLGTAINTIHHFSKVKDRVSDGLETVVCVALAHDLLEDTRVDANGLESVAGRKVRSYVEALTKPPAGVIGKSSVDRNTEFAVRIIAGGPTSVYVKLCDNLQNLSRPTLTPSHLFKKILQKTEFHYLPMLNECSLGSDFRQIYEDSIAQAKRALERETLRGVKSDGPLTLERALTVCVLESAGKILELHDIPPILSGVCGADNVTIWSCGGKLLDNLTFVCGSESYELARQVKVPNLSENPRKLQGKSLMLMSKALSNGAYALILTVPMNVSAESSYIVSVGFQNGSAEWITVDAVTVLTQFLAHRLIVSESDRRLSLASKMTKLGLQIDLELAAGMGMTPAELTELQLWQARCKQAILTVEHLIKGFLAGDSLRSPLSDLIRVESRIKTIDSILHKFKMSGSKRKWPDFKSLEDIAGVRVVCPTLVELRNIEIFLLESKVAKSKVSLHSEILDNRRDYLETPLSNGYKALHLIFEVEVLGEDGPVVVPCEVQLRTMFMDLWAAISHLTLYQADHNTRRRKGELLKELGVAMEQAEEVARKLVARLDGQ
jgi:ppGpp synthetase/RelA/SpoT-type nucleotidyltranferase